jgi:hypothetical protein
MSQLRRFANRSACALTVVAALLILSPSPARAQFFGAGWGYGYPGYGYGYFGYGYGYPGYGYGYPSYGYGYGNPWYGGFYPGYGSAFAPPAIAYGYGPALPYAGPLFASPYANPLFGLGLSPLGVQSYFTEANLLGRGQLEADRRARARELLRNGR